MKPRQPLHLALSALLTLAAAAAQAQDIKFANIVEMSGPGTTSGVMFKNGVELAIKEINAAGGIMGRKISYTSEDTQSNPGVAKGLTQKAVDNDVFAIFGPVFSGSIMVSMAESKRGETPNFTGGEATASSRDDGSAVAVAAARLRCPHYGGDLDNVVQHWCAAAALNRSRGARKARPVRLPCRQLCGMPAGHRYPQHCRCGFLMGVKCGSRLT